MQRNIVFSFSLLFISAAFLICGLQISHNGSRVVRSKPWAGVGVRAFQTNNICYMQLPNVVYASNEESLADIVLTSMPDEPMSDRFRRVVTLLSGGLVFG